MGANLEAIDRVKRYQDFAGGDTVAYRNGRRADDGIERCEYLATFDHKSGFFEFCSILIESGLQFAEVNRVTFDFILARINRQLLATQRTARYVEDRVCA